MTRPELRALIAAILTTNFRVNDTQKLPEASALMLADRLLEESDRWQERIKKTPRLQHIPTDELIEEIEKRRISHTAHLQLAAKADLPHAEG